MLESQILIGELRTNWSTFNGDVIGILSFGIVMKEIQAHFL